MRKLTLSKVRRKVRELEVLTEYSQIKLSAAKDHLKENEYCYDAQFEVKALQNELDSQLNQLETLYGYFSLHYKEDEKAEACLV